MSIEAINEQLLRAIGVGVALLNRETLQFGFRNDTFDEWFSGDTPLDHLQQLFPDLDADAVQKSLLETRRYTSEISFKKKR
ncbi:MAG: adenylate/guanylate cyclase domain-containing protein, partial [Pseudomonadota bacterium]